jgi:putative alpha-1,2-mannosidase
MCIRDRLYNYTPDGYCGDEDNGQTSAWYVFSALGFYPVTPGTAEYALGSPLFTKATVTLSDGKELVINAPENGPGQVYVSSVKLNGRSLDVNYVTHSQLTAGGTLEFSMSQVPEMKRGINPSSRPYSMSTASPSRAGRQ